MRGYSRAEEHTGEWKVTVWADTLPQLFATLARVVARTCSATRGPAGPWEHVAITSRDRTVLLVDWANEILGRSEVSRRAFEEVRRLCISDRRLSADVRGCRVAAWRSPLKAATYHGLVLEQHGRRWKAVVLFDV